MALGRTVKLGYARLLVSALVYSALCQEQPPQDNEEDFYDSEEESEEEIITTTTTTTVKPDMVLEGWHFIMMAVGASMFLLAIGAGLGAVRALRKGRQEDEEFCDCDKECQQPASSALK